MVGKTLMIAAMALIWGGRAAAQGDAEAGMRVFNKCKACHQIGPDAKNVVGPHLTGVVGRPVASVEGFNYSDALLEKGGGEEVWTEEMIAQYIADPRDYIPGNKMAFAGLNKPEEVENVIAYIESFQ